MSNTLNVIRGRHSSRGAFDPEHPPTKHDIEQILEAARWAPTAHNMQNFEIIVVDDKKVLKEIGGIEFRISEEFIRENYQQLSFSEEELLRKKVGILGTMFPPLWRKPDVDVKKIVREAGPSFLRDTMRDSPVVMIVVYDARKRAPASKGDFLGILSLGCVMENMWLIAEDLGINFHVMSVFSSDHVEKELKRILDLPENTKIAFTCRLGYPKSASTKYLRVRRDVDDFTHHNRFGKK